MSYGYPPPGQYTPQQGDAYPPQMPYSNSSYPVQPSSYGQQPQYPPQQYSQQHYGQQPQGFAPPSNQYPPVTGQGFAPPPSGGSVQGFAPPSTADHYGNQAPQQQYPVHAPGGQGFAPPPSGGAPSAYPSYPQQGGSVGNQQSKYPSWQGGSTSSQAPQAYPVQPYGGTSSTPAYPSSSVYPSYGSSSSQYQEQGYAQTSAVPESLRKLAKEGHCSFIVRLISARKLKAADLNGKSDPYVRIYWEGMPRPYTKKRADKKVKNKVGGRHKYKTSIIKKTLKPEWNENFVMHVPGSIRANDVISFVVWDYDKVGEHDYIGSAHLRMDGLSPGQERVGWHKLENVRKGEIQIGITPINFDTLGQVATYHDGATEIARKSTKQKAINKKKRMAAKIAKGVAIGVGVAAVGALVIGATVVTGNPLLMVAAVAVASGGKTGRRGRRY